MVNFIRRLFYRPALRLGSLGQQRQGGVRLRNERFASYLADNNRRSLDTDLKDAMLAGRRLMRAALCLGLLALVAWVAMESAQAIGVF